jgi:hypothetical protein
LPANSHPLFSAIQKPASGGLFVAPVKAGVFISHVHLSVTPAPAGVQINGRDTRN